jgi:Putative peptidoglycan binding domain
MQIKFLHAPLAGLMALGVMGCQSAPSVGLAQKPGQIAVLRLDEGESPPPENGVCWASDTAPAVIETVTQQVQVRPELRDAAGTITQAAQFQTRTKQRMVSDRETIWFKSPCADAQTVAFVASLQRALKARGWYNAPVTGAWDDATLAALRTYQRSRGLDSAQISLAAAQDLGLVAADL